MKRLFSCIIFTLTFIIGYSFHSQLSLECTAPQNVNTASILGGNISFDWDNCTGSCTEYAIYYVREEGSYYSPEFTTSSSDISFSNLEDGTYDFYFVTVCGSERSAAIVIEEFISN